VVNVASVEPELEDVLKAPGASSFAGRCAEVGMGTT